MVQAQTPATFLSSRQQPPNLEWECFRSLEASGLGPAWQRRVPAGAGGRGPGGSGPGRPLQERRGTLLRRARETMPRPAPAPAAGRAPHPPAPAPGRAARAPLREGARSPPRRPERPHPRIPGARTPLDRRARPCGARGRRPPRAPGTPPRSPDPPGALCRLLSERGPGRGRRRPRTLPPPTARGPAEPVRAPRDSPGPGGPLGIIPSRAWRRLLGGGADARAPAPLGRPIVALGAESGRRPEQPAGREARAGGCRSAECRPVAAAAAAARRGSRARRRKGRATMCRGEEAAATRAARTIPLGGGGRGFQEIQTLRQEIGILTKHSRPRGRPTPGAPASLNPWPAGTLAGGRRGL